MSLPHRYTQYIPLSIYELQSWLGTPSIYVLDCSAAGLIINAFRAFMDQRTQPGQVWVDGASVDQGIHPGRVMGSGITRTWRTATPCDSRGTLHFFGMLHDCGVCRSVGYF